MGLSTNDAREQITATQVVLKLVDALNGLDKKSIAQLSKDAYALPEAEQKKADEARQQITTYQDLLAQEKKQSALIEEAQDNLDLRKTEIENAVIEIDKRSKALDERESIAKKTDILTADGVRKLSEGQKALAEGQAKLDKDKAALEADKVAFAAKQAEAKDRADEIKRLSEGM